MKRIEEIAAGMGYHVRNGYAFGPKGLQKTSPDSKGYLRIGIYVEGKTRTCWVHRLVAFQKFGDALYLNRPDVRHLDGDHQNNLDDNIALGTRSMNLLDIPPTERSDRAKRVNVKKHGELRARIDAALATGISQAKVAKLVGCAESTVFNQSKRKDRN
jgi:hypothetical protein